MSNWDKVETTRDSQGNLVGVKVHDRVPDRSGPYEKFGAYVGAIAGGIVGLGAFKVAAAALTGTALTTAAPAMILIFAASAAVGLMIHTALDRNNGPLIGPLMTNVVMSSIIGKYSSLLLGSVFPAVVGGFVSAAFATGGAGIGKAVGRRFDERRAARLEVS